MANAVKKLNTIALANIEKVNTITDANLENLNTLEFSGVTDAHVLIATDTSDGSDASLGFTSGINDTYDVYEFVFTNIHPETDSVFFTFQVNADGDTGYNTSPITSNFFAAYNDAPPETNSAMGYDGGKDAHASTGEIKLSAWAGSDTDESISGKMTLYAPSSGTYIKHFLSRFSTKKVDPAEYTTQIAGIIDDTTAIDDIRFMMSSGEIQGGEIKMYGLAKS